MPKKDNHSQNKDLQQAESGAYKPAYKENPKTAENQAETTYENLCPDLAKKPAETEQNDMTKKYVKLAEQFARNLEDWANPKDKTGLRYEYIGHLKPIRIALEGFDELLDWLHSNEAELGKVVQAEYDKLVSQAKCSDYIPVITILKFFHSVLLLRGVFTNGRHLLVQFPKAVIDWL